MTGVFGAISLTTGLLSALRRGDVTDTPAPSQKSEGQPPSQSQPGPRLVGIAPAFSPEGFSATATMRF
ncbi:MAG TPA: hypothetical protein PKI03_09535, partial [Pseudomonadota bacterium]|nr:hypothetical protein [Pseudomonadota bacterium]